MWHRWGRVGCLLLSFAVMAFSAFVIGALIGDQGAYKRHADEQARDIEPILSACPEFSDLKVEHSSVGWVMVVGKVDSRSDLAKLRGRLTEVIGAKRTDFALDFVEVSE